MGMTRKESAELDRLRRANAGDASAKREIEAGELLKKADQVTLTLRDKAAGGDSQAMTALRRIANGAAPAAPVATTAKPSSKQLDNARAAGCQIERARFAAVFASEHSRGRERGCVALLTANDGWSAAQIVANLADLPTDKEGRSTSPAGREKADGVWDRANAEVGRASPAAAPKDTARKTSSDPWERAYSKIRKEG